MEENKQEENIFDEELLKDKLAFEAFINNIYAKAVPPPQKPTEKDLSFFSLAGLELSLFVLSALGAAVLSAVRTGGLFYVLEILLISRFGLGDVLGNLFGTISMVAALFAFEGFLIAYGVRHGRESGKLNVSKWGLGVSFLTVISAGVFSSFSIVNISGTPFESFMNILLAIITGFASALTAYYASDNMGHILNFVTASKNSLLQGHQEAYQVWIDGANKAYTSSKYNIRGKRASQIYGNGLLQSNFNSEVGASNPLQNTANLEPKLKSNEIAANFIEAFLNKNGRMPTQTEIVDGANVGTTSAFYYMCEYMVNNADRLIASNIRRGDGSLVTPEMIQKAKDSLDKSRKQSQ